MGNIAAATGGSAGVSRTFSYMYRMFDLLVVFRIGESTSTQINFEPQRPISGLGINIAATGAVDREFTFIFDIFLETLNF